MKPSEQYFALKLKRAAALRAIGEAIGGFLLGAAIMGAFLLVGTAMVGGWVALHRSWIWDDHESRIHALETKPAPEVEPYPTAQWSINPAHHFVQFGAPGTNGYEVLVTNWPWN